MKIAFFSAKPYDKEAFDPMAVKMGYKIDYFENKLNPDTASSVIGYDAICSFVNDNLDAQTVKILKNSGIKAILLRCAGYDSVDIRKASEVQLPIFRVPNYSPEAVAEFAVTLLLAVNRKVHVGYNRTKMFNFDINGLQGSVLKGKTAGVIGTGRIGKATIDILNGFGMNVIAYDIYPDISSNIKYVTLDELYSNSDVIMLHMPLTPETKHIINLESISKMKDNVFLINTARGGLIKTDDLFSALDNDKFGGVGLDVCEYEKDYFFENKTDKKNKNESLRKLLSYDRLLLTGHQGFFTKEAMSAIAKVTLSNFRNYIEKGDLTNQVGII